MQVAALVNDQKFEKTMATTGGDSFVFTEEEVQQELARLGITNIDKVSLQQFRHELQDLVHEVSAGSGGFPDVSSSSTSAGINSGNSCSDMSSSIEGKYMMAKSSSLRSSSQSPLSVASPLLTPPLGKNDSDISMTVCRNPPNEPGKYGDVGITAPCGVVRTDSSSPPPRPSWKNSQVEVGRPEKSYVSSSVGHVRAAWEDPIMGKDPAWKDPTGFPPAPRKNLNFGRNRQINLNSGTKQSCVGSSTMETQRQENISIFNGRYPPQQEDVSPTSSLQEDKSALEIGISNRNGVFRSTKDTTDYRLRNKENENNTMTTTTTSSYDTRTRPFISLSHQQQPPETQKVEPSLHDIEIQNSNNGFLEELLRVYSSHSPPTAENINNINNVIPPAKKFTKRKIVRKDSEGKSYVDESYTESESGSLLDPVEYMERLREMNKSIYDIAGEGGGASDVASETYYPPRAPFSITDNRPRSVILTPTTPPKLKKNKKSDPVNRYHQFRDYWAHHKVPGESRHSDLRWCIKERMLHHDQIESRPRKVYVPNNYVVPTEKHRGALRWQIRTDLAYGFMPSSRNSYNF